ncbi:hypothetical protein MNBD_NITROSPINAE01-1862 [hydrothermal vent metagenome]|uniref:Protein translocase subunit SecE n=1 Tax=hydrothermal vent metagenome TaxID=652676 RepID=A0A3B1BUM8_9ZZZZ
MEQIRKFSQYLKEVKIETKKVTFPSRKDTIATTIAVLVVVMLIGFYLGVVDFILSKLVGLALN